MSVAGTVGSAGEQGTHHPEVLGEAGKVLHVQQHSKRARCRKQQGAHLASHPAAGLTDASSGPALASRGVDRGDGADLRRCVVRNQALAVDRGAAARASITAIATCGNKPQTNREAWCNARLAQVQSSARGHHTVDSPAAPTAPAPDALPPAPPSPASPPVDKEGTQAEGRHLGAGGSWRDARQPVKAAAPPRRGGLITWQYRLTRSSNSASAN